MADLKVSDWISDVSGILANPTSIQRLSLQRLRDIKDGLIDTPDATSPFAFTLENSAINIAGFIEKAQLLTRKQYPSVAQTVDDLYLHMSDKDFVDRFATPARANFYVLIERKSLEKALVLDPVTGISKITIPRNTEFKVENYVFSIQYPIEIKKLVHGGFQVNYNTDIESPLEILTTNVVEQKFVKLSNVEEFMMLNIPAQQFNIKSFTESLSSSKVFKKTISYSNNFYFARVFYKNNATGSSWKEIRTTHTDQVYDPTIPTAVLKVNYGTLDVFIPQIYFSTSALSGSIRVDIYQTLGEMSLSMGNYNQNSFSANWKTIDKSEDTPEVAALRNISNVAILSTSTINSGTNALSFDELRRRVINNTVGARDLPITNVQIEDSVKSMGFEIVKNVDVVTNRMFLATRQLPTPFDEKLITAAATSIQSAIVTMREISKHPAVFDNGDRITLTPDLVYRLNNGKVEVVSSSTVMSIINASPDDTATLVNKEDFIYSPFHYVMDATDTQFRLRPYYMDSPTASIRQFVDHNDTTLLEANTNNYSLTRTDFGYRLTVEIKGNATYGSLPDNMIFAQLFYVPKGEVSKAYINGMLVSRTDDGGAIFIFDLSSTFDIDDENNLFFNNFTMANLIDQKFPSGLEQTFNVVYGTFSQASNIWIQHKIDNDIGQFILPSHGYAITEESFTLEFGKFLKNLWAGCKSYPSVLNYKRHETDVPSTYPEDIFAINPDNGTIIFFDDDNNISYKYKHRKGDIILDDNGEIQYMYRKGDIVFDSEGKPVAASELEVARQIDLVMIEGTYYFANDSSSSTYKNTVIAAMVDWITDDIETISKQTLDETSVFYYPKINMGSIKLISENGSLVYMQASQSFSVRYFVAKQVMKNSDLRNSLTNLAISTIDTELKKSNVSLSTITSKLRTAAGDDVISIEVTGLGGAANYQTVSLIGDGDRLSIKKKLSAQTDGKLIVVEDVTVEFIYHGNSDEEN